MVASPPSIAELTRQGALSDEEVVQRVRQGQTALFEVLMRRHNVRLYRAIRGILRDESEVEDAMQQAYIAAYTCLEQFNQEAKFSTWLTRIAINEALSRLRQRARLTVVDPASHPEDTMDATSVQPRTPEQQAASREMVTLLESAIDTLPERYRVVVMLREVEGLSTHETAEALGLTEENVKVRLHRAREKLRDELIARMGSAAPDTFQFHAKRCDRVVAAVMARLPQGRIPRKSEIL